MQADNRTIAGKRKKTRGKYALAGYTKPMGVAEWERQITESLPENLKSSLPTIEEIEEELGKTGGGYWHEKKTGKNFAIRNPCPACPVGGNHRTGVKSIII